MSAVPSAGVSRVLPAAAPAAGPRARAGGILRTRRAQLAVSVGAGLLALGLVGWGTLLAIAVIVGAGLLSRIYPHAVPSGPDVGGYAQHRLQYPLSYWNAFGALAAMGALLAGGLAADSHSPIPLRATAAAG